MPTFVTLINKGRLTPAYRDERTGLSFVRSGALSPDLDDYPTYKDLTGIADAIADDIIKVMQDDRHIFGRTEGHTVKNSVGRGAYGVGGGGSSPTTNIRVGNVPIANGANSVNIIISPPFTTNLYSLNVSIINTSDPNPSQFFTTETNKTNSGFTVNLSGWTDTGNYVASWMAIHP